MVWDAQDGRCPGFSQESSLHPLLGCPPAPHDMPTAGPAPPAKDSVKSATDQCRVDQTRSGTLAGGQRAQGPTQLASRGQKRVGGLLFAAPHPIGRLWHPLTLTGRSRGLRASKFATDAALVSLLDLDAPMVPTPRRNDPEDQKIAPGGPGAGPGLSTLTQHDLCDQKWRNSREELIRPLDDIERKMLGENGPQEVTQHHPLLPSP